MKPIIRETLEDIPRWEYEEMPKIERAKMHEINLSERLKNFAEVEKD